MGYGSLNGLLLGVKDTGHVTKENYLTIKAIVFSLVFIDYLVFFVCFSFSSL